MVRELPWYFAYDGIPVRVIRTDDGGMDVQRFDPETGAGTKCRNQMRGDGPIRMA